MGLCGSWQLWHAETMTSSRAHPMPKPAIQEIPPEELQGEVNESELEALNARFAAIAARLSSAERPLPFVFEFLGTPKAGKTSVRDMIGRLAEKNGFRVFCPIEGASLPSRRVLREDLVAYNAWTGCYALQTLLTACIPVSQHDLVLFDRGIVDAACWFEALARLNLLEAHASEIIRPFFTLGKWTRYLDGLILMTCDPAVSASRESEANLARTGNVATSDEFLNELSHVYRHGGTRTSELDEEIAVVGIDTSAEGCGLARTALVVANYLAKTMESKLNPLYITIATESIRFRGFRPVEPALLKEWERIRRTTPRDDAETDASQKQLVAYAFIEAGDKILRLRRAGPANRPELRKKLSIGVGGHAESIDDSGESPLEEVLKQALQRELREELIFDVAPELDLVGFINDESIEAGKYHIAAVFRAVFPTGRLRVRPDVSDQEFGAKSWALVPREKLFAASGDFDPWSQYIIEHVLGGPKVQLDTQAVLPFERQ